MEHITKQEDVTVGRIINSLNTLDDENMVTVSDIEPSNPKEGEIWVNPNEISEEKEVTYVGHSIGDIYPISYTELEAGQLVLKGQLVSRQVYANLWAWLQKHPSLLKTEQEYAEYLAAAENLCCPYFTSGTTENNFRLPNYNGVFFKATNDTSKINEFETDKQRNITGSYVQLATSWDNGGRGVISFSMSGCYSSTDGGTTNDSIYQDPSDRTGITVDFDAYRSVGTEHTGSEVKPKSINQVWVVQAFGVVTNASSVDLNIVEQQIEQLLNYGSYEIACIKNNKKFYNRDELFTPNKTNITIHKNLQINIGGNPYISTIDKVLQLTSLGTLDSLGGKDVYIYACASSTTEPNFVLSLNSTIPSGYTAETSRKIGGFHCLCADVGTIKGHTLSGYLKGYILPLSVWDLLHRPVSDSEGMVYIKEINKWVDIYLCSWSGNSLESKFGAVICDGVSATNFHGEGFSEQFRLISKRPLFRNEFATVAKGSNERTNIKNSTDPNTTGGHIDTAGRRMISNYGLEDCCGVLWQWGEDLFDCASAAGISWSSRNFYLSGYSWQTKSVYNSAYDSQTYGDCLGLLRRVLLGAGWGDGARCGSRSARCDVFSSSGVSGCSSRGASEPRLVNL